MAIKLNLNIIVHIFQDNGYYVVFSPDLQISTYAKSIEQAKKRFEERVQIFLDISLEKGDLDKRLEKLGWTIVDHPQKELFPPEKVTVPRDLMDRQCQSEHLSYAV